MAVLSLLQNSVDAFPDHQRDKNNCSMVLITLCSYTYQDYRKVDGL